MSEISSPVVMVYDTTCRDGTQGEDIALSVQDKVRIAMRLDALGIHYVEGGWPGANPRDDEFFREIANYDFKTTKIAVFSSTAHPSRVTHEDPYLRTIIESKAPVATLFGKSWDIHVRQMLRVSLERNLEIIRESVAFVLPHFQEVIYDAEHFFDGFKADPAYALQALRAAQEGGAHVLVLCDTNGGTLPSTLMDIIKEVSKHVDRPLGIHVHNDSDMAVACTVAAVEMGASHVQGTINGYGERCGNANLCSVIPTVQLKLGIPCIKDEQLKRLPEVSRFVAELTNQIPSKHQPYVGQSAFAHKAGMHVAAIEKNPRAYEHIEPERVGNKRRILVSDLSGKGNVLLKAAEYGIPLEAKDPQTLSILQTLKELEKEGFQFEGAEASFELLMKQALGVRRRNFDLMGFRVIVEKRQEGEEPISEATIRVRVGGAEAHTAALGNGPVNALDNAIRKALERFYPELKEMELVDFKVRVLTAGAGTEAKVRVLIESSDGRERWSTVGVSQNIIEASWQALVDSIDYRLQNGMEKKRSGEPRP
jgi:2-isopropylmalate synthase